MIAMLEQKEKSQKSCRFSLFQRRSDDVKVHYEDFFGLPIIRIILMEKSGEKYGKIKKKLTSIHALLNEHNVKKICFHRKFEYSRYFLENGFKATDMSCLRQMKIAETAEKAMRAGDEYLAVFSDYEDIRDASELICKLKNKFRFFMVDFGEISEVVCGNLAMKYGISAISRPGYKQLKRADLAIFFGKYSTELELGTDTTTIFCRAGYGCPKAERYVNKIEFCMDGKEADRYVPEGYSGAELLAEAVSAGRIKLARIQVKNVEIIDKLKKIEQNNKI